jgi:mannitol/fructose-specific phosphotransferase system IIA component (Ntr-type)
VADVLPFYLAVLDRESLMASDWEAGLAFPHARLLALKEPAFALGRSDEPLRWGGTAVRSVRLVFLIAVPATDWTQYLSLISGLARLAEDSQVVKKLHAAKNNFQMFDVLRNVALQASKLLNPNQAPAPLPLADPR